MKDLPVDPARLKAQFPALTDDDVDAYVFVTRRILAASTAEDRARITRETLTLGRAAQGKLAGNETLSSREQSALRYVTALEKMQARAPG